MSNLSSPMLTTGPLHARIALFADPHEIAPDVLMHASFVNTYALRTSSRLLLVDPGFEPAAPAVHKATRADPTDCPAQQLKHDVYERRLAQEPALMAQGDLPRRDERR
jgi:hypothetical protein